MIQVETVNNSSYRRVETTLVLCFDFESGTAKTLETVEISSYEIKLPFVRVI